ncbi:MAG: hypothetical protein OHK0046_21790 [Anaerolineae bacterium]
MSAEEAVQEQSNRRRKRREAEAEIDDTILEEENRGITQGKGRVTPGRRNRAATTTDTGGNIVTRTVRSIRDYFRGVQDEMTKVVWPTRDELVRLTRIVLAVTIMSSLVLGLIAFAFTELFILGFQNEWIFAAFFGIVLIIFFAVRRMNAQAEDLKRY